MNNDNFLIEEHDLELAREICKYIDKPETRNRAVANSLAANIASKYFVEVDVDTKSGIHNIAKVLEDIEVSDVYINGSYIDVRFYFDGGDLTIPKDSFDKGLVPIAYMFVKLESEISGALVTGFVLPSSVENSVAKDGYYILSEDNLTSFYDIQPLLITPEDVDIPDNFEMQVFDYLDSRMTDKTDFYRLLLSSEEAREKLATAANVQNIFNFVSFNTSNKETDSESILIENNITLNEVSDNDSLHTYGDERILELADDSDSDLISLESNSLDLNEASDSIDLDLELEEDISEEEFIEETILESQDVQEFVSIDESDDTIIDCNEDKELTELSELRTEQENIDAKLVEENIEISESIDNDEIEDSYEYSTTVTPSLEVYEDSDLTEEDLEDTEIEIPSETSKTIVVNDELEEADEQQLEQQPEEHIINEEETDNITETENNMPESITDENAEQIDVLFNADKEDYPVSQTKPKSSGLLVTIALLVALGGAGYYAYTNHFTNENVSENIPETQPIVAEKEQNTPNKEETTAMPNETVENIKQPTVTNEGNAIDVPSIEQNLGTTVSVTNLKVSWEVPSSYVTSRSISRYFEKMGKVLQLNLKTDLMLVNKPILSNKIAIELEFDKNTQKFVTKRVVTSSGDSSIDKLIMQTITKVLDMSLKTNMNVFKTLSGKPVLLIHL